MNSLVRFIEMNGGTEYTFVYPKNILKNKYTASNTTCAWHNNELIVNSRLVEYVKFFQSNEIRVCENINNRQSSFHTINGFDSRNVISRYANGKLYKTNELIFPKCTCCDCYYRGLEDGRLVSWNGKLYIYGTRWDKVRDKGCICIYELDENRGPINEIIIRPQGTGNCEKNWGAVEDKPFTFIYSNNPLDVIQVNKKGECQLIKHNEKNETIDKWIKGSTQVVRYDENTYISMVHTNDWREVDGISYSDYLTAFVFYDNDFNIIKMSDWFVFKSPMCEFTCGLAIHDNDVYITYSQLDCTSHLVVTNKETIEKFIDNSNRLNIIDSFIDYYQLAKQNENNGQYVAQFGLYNYAALLADDNGIFNEMKEECLIKMFCGIVKFGDTYRDKSLLNEIKNTLIKFSEKYPNSCEFYYLIGFISKLMQDFNEVAKWKQLGDEHKTNMNSYFFNYFNPNYL